MRSPFPGMDPYLEAPARWPSVHHRLISTIADMLGAALAPAFFVTIEERVYIATADDLAGMSWFFPDVFVISTGERGAISGAGTVITPPRVIETLDQVEVHDHYLEIIDTEAREVVTTIEVLSPTNKATGTTGRSEYLAKRRRVLTSSTHWIEIDLLRGGERPPQLYVRGSYYALLHRGENGSRHEVWESSLRDRLPVIAVPTRRPLPDTPLDLQGVVDEVYRRGRYDLAINYDGPISPPPLSADDAAWVQEQVARRRSTRDE